jgi:hypothetical protein
MRKVKCEYKHARWLLHFTLDDHQPAQPVF